MSAQKWIPIEANPDVMNKLLANVGVPSEWSVSDVIGVDEELLPFIAGPVVALIFLYPPTVHREEVNESQTKEDDLKNVFFMRQTIRNVCGTIALIHSVANNCDRIQLRDGSSLKTFLDLSQDLSPEERGRLLESNEGICSAHQIYSKEGQTSPESEETGHFVAFVQRNGYLYELSGGTPFPKNRGKSCEETFLSDAARVCRQYMARDPNNPKFSVLALSQRTDD